jgi:hypothetical protein
VKCCKRSASTNGMTIGIMENYSEEDKFQLWFSLKCMQKFLQDAGNIPSTTSPVPTPKGIISSFITTGPTYLYVTLCDCYYKL